MTEVTITIIKVQLFEFGIRAYRTQISLEYTYAIIRIVQERLTITNVTLKEIKWRSIDTLIWTEENRNIEDNVKSMHFQSATQNLVKFVPQIGNILQRGKKVNKADQI